MTTRLRWLAGVAAAIVVLLGSVAWPQPASAATTLVYATFKGDAVADEELWLYQSTNGGTSYSVLADTNFHGPTGVLRDPSILKSGGTYYVAYTVQSWTTNSTYFNIASSTNLTTWRNIASINSGIANTKFTWAPEFYVEGGIVRLITSVAASTCSACFRPYVYTAQNAALTSWSGPAQTWGLGTNHIDTFVVKSGSTWHASPRTRRPSTSSTGRPRPASPPAGSTRAICGPPATKDLPWYAWTAAAGGSMSTGTAPARVSSPRPAPTSTPGPA